MNKEDLDKIFEEMRVFQDKFCNESEYNQMLYAYIGNACAAAVIHRIVDKNPTTLDELKAVLTNQFAKACMSSVRAYEAMKKIKEDFKNEKEGAKEKS